MLYTYVTRCRSNSGKQVCADSSVTVTYLVTGIVSNGGCKVQQFQCLRWMGVFVHVCMLISVGYLKLSWFLTIVSYTDL